MKAILEITFSGIIVLIIVLMVWLFVADINSSTNEWKLAEDRRWKANGERIARCEAVGGIPILDRSQWMARCDFPPQPCASSVPVERTGGLLH